MNVVQQLAVAASQYTLQLQALGSSTSSYCSLLVQKFEIMSFLSTLLLAAIVLIAPLHILGDPSTTTELLWPLPRMSVFGSSVYSVDTVNFEFIGKGNGGESAILKGAFERYTRLIFQTPVPFYPSGGGVVPTGVVDGVIVNVANSSEDLGPDTDESCEPIL